MGPMSMCMASICVDDGLHLGLDAGHGLVVDVDLDVVDLIEDGLDFELVLGDAFEIGFDALLGLLHFSHGRLELGAGLSRTGFGGLDRGDGRDQGCGENGCGQNDREADLAVFGSIQNAHDAFLQVRSPGHFETGDGKGWAMDRGAGDAQ